MKFHFDRVQDLAGFVAENTRGPGKAKVVTRDLLTSDDPQFYNYSEQISNIFLSKARIPVDAVYQFLVIIHQDLSADLYVNDINVIVDIRTKRSVKAGEVILLDDIADIGKINFSGIDIKDTDKVVYCFKVGWRFGLFFDLTPRIQPPGLTESIGAQKLDVEKMKVSLGELRRYLTFYHVYKVVETDAQFEEMMKDGWFPFVEIIGGEYKKLSETYQNKFDFENRIKSIIDGFNEERINAVMQRWWGHPVFASKKALIEAGVNAYLQNNQSGFINCIKNLWTEIEGILRELYHIEKGKGDGIKAQDLINYIIEKAKHKSGSDFSLLLPLPFLKYLQEVVFPNFNVETGEIDMSRHTSSHGVAKPEQYTKDRALQLILILDQIYFCS